MGIDVKTIHKGQYKPYGDSYYVYEVTAVYTTEQVVLDYCKKELHPCTEESYEWHKNIRWGGAKSGDASYYFNGYYVFKKINENKYQYTVVKPYTG